MASMLLEHNPQKKRSKRAMKKRSIGLQRAPKGSKGLQRAGDCNQCTTLEACTGYLTLVYSVSLLP